ncbi:MAG: hypothetical protein AB8B57_04060 [Congregibacter sp.]
MVDGGGPLSPIGGALPARSVQSSTRRRRRRQRRSPEDLEDNQEDVLGDSSDAGQPQKAKGRFIDLRC